MLQRDYFLRMTEMLAAALAKIIFNKENKNFDEAEAELETAGKTIIGLDLKFIKILGVEDVVQLLKSSDMYAGKCFITAGLLNESGNISELKGNESESINLYSKSLSLYTEALLTNEIPEKEKYFTVVNNLISKLSGFEFQDEFYSRLADYYELSGQLSKAEDVLFDLLGENPQKYFDKAVLFYKKLQLKPDKELADGNLSREEIEDSLEEVLSLRDISDSE